jgi:hypothetical protein
MSTKELDHMQCVRLLAAFQVLSLPSGELGATHKQARATILEITGKKQRGKVPAGWPLEHYLATIGFAVAFGGGKS